jgi:hypothetical protein
VWEAGFTVGVDPEFPPNGGEAPQRIPANLTRIGAVLRLTAPASAPWDIAVGAPNWWRTPIPTAIAFISDWAGYLVDVVERRILVEEQGVVRIRQDQQHGLVLLIRPYDMTAVGPEGVAWHSDQIAGDDLKVVAIDDRGIVCTGYDGGEFPSEFVVDPATGKVLPT